MSRGYRTRGRKVINENTYRCTKWIPLRVSPLSERQKAALPRMIEEQKGLCFNRIQGDGACDVGQPSYLLCPGCKGFKERYKVPTREEEG